MFVNTYYVISNWLHKAKRSSFAEVMEEWQHYMDKLRAVVEISVRWLIIIGAN